MNCGVHLSRHMGRLAPRFFIAQTAQKDKEKVKPIDAGFLVVRLAFLELSNDLLENMAVFQGSAAVDHMFSVFETIVPQDVGDI